MTIQSTITSIANDTAKLNAEKAKKTMGSGTMDQDAFLRLLMEQIKSQDPSKPMDSSQMISQTAQFTQITELQKLNKSVSNTNGLMQASSLIGKDVTIIDPDDDQKTISGVVSQASMDDKGANIVIGDKAYPVSSIKIIKEHTQS